MSRLDTFTKTYILTILWSERDSSGETLNKNYHLTDFSEEATDKICEDCQTFRDQYASEIEHINSRNRSSSEIAAENFWLTRQRNPDKGCWSRDDVADDVKENLTQACRKYKSCYVFVGDDNKLYLDTGE